MDNKCYKDGIESIDIIFFKVWRNKVIRTIILKYAKLIRNEIKIFKSTKSSREYGEKEFISTIVYKDHYSTKIDDILKGDLPENGLLKVVDLTGCLFSIITSGDVIPQGVEIIHFSGYQEIQLSELPSSIHTLTKVTLKKPYIQNQIPENITSLSFHSNMDTQEFYNSIKLPNSIKVLDLSCFENYIYVQPIVSTFPFIPSSVTNLTCCYQEQYKSNLPKIPSSVTKLKLMINGNCTIEKGIIPYGVKDLNIQMLFSSQGGIEIEDYSLPESITKLSIFIDHSWEIWGFQTEETKPSKINVNSIPSSVLDLYIQFGYYPLSIKNILPNSLTRLEITSTFENIFPIGFSYPTLSGIDLQKIISHLPQTVKYLKVEGREIDLNKNLCFFFIIFQE